MLINNNNAIEEEYEVYRQRVLYLAAFMIPPERLFVPNIRFSLNEVSDVNALFNFR